MDSTPTDKCRIEFLGWDTHQTHDPLPFPENFGVRLLICHRIYSTGDGPVEECVSHLGLFSATKQLILDHIEATNYFSSRFSAIGIPGWFHSGLVEEIAIEYNDAISRVTTKTDNELPVIMFDIEVETWRQEDEEVAGGIEEEEDLMEAETSRSPTPASKAVIDALQEVNYIHCSHSSERCVICLENFEIGKKVQRMPCCHMFHGDCIVRWLEISHLCPLCRIETPRKPCPCYDQN